MIITNSFITAQEKRLIRKRKNARWSKGETIIRKFLNENRIEFIPEFYFNELSVRGKPKLLFFDFYIPSYGICIEFDGEQHYTRKFHGKPIKNGETNDFLKNAFCLKKGYKMLRIKYTNIDNTEKIICEFFDKYYPI